MNRCLATIRLVDFPAVLLPRVPSVPALQFRTAPLPRILPPRFSHPARSYAQSRRPRPQRFEGFNGSRTTGQRLRGAFKPPVVAFIGGVGLLVYIYGQEKVPVSGRRRWNIFSPEIVKQITAGSKEQIIQQYRGLILPPDHAVSREVERVLKRLIPVCGLSGESWEVRIIDDKDTPNAFVMPGGKVFVFTGILPICQNEQGVAAVLAHEIAHNVANHSGERLAKSLIFTIFALAISLVYDTSLQTTNFALRYLLDLPSSRAQEEEADHIGLLMMAQACYDPDAARQLWQRMDKADKEKIPKFLSTHPTNRDRIKNIQALLPEAYEHYQMSDCQATYSQFESFKNASKNASDLW